MRVTKNGHVFNIIVTPDTEWFWRDNWAIWEPETFNILERLLTPETTYLDLGAWVGPTVLYASRLCKRCLAVEPDVIAFRQLWNNVNMDGAKNVEVYCEAILNRGGLVEMGAEDRLGLSQTRLGVKENPFLSVCSTLESFVIRNQVRQPIFIKVDVEGAEEKIFETVDFFRKWKPTVYVSRHPQWFEDADRGTEVLRAVGRLYAHHYDFNLKEVDIEGSEWAVFTDVAL